MKLKNYQFTILVILSLLEFINVVAGFSSLNTCNLVSLKDIGLNKKRQTSSILCDENISKRRVLMSRPRLNLALNLFGRNGKDKKEIGKEDVLLDIDNEKDFESKSNLSSSSSTGMGNTAVAMKNFKKNQEIWKRTAMLMEELSALTIDGVAADGKIKVQVDGQQRPKGVEIDDSCLVNESLADDLTEAMQKAHSKSCAMMNEKIQTLYTELGLPA